MPASRFSMVRGALLTGTGEEDVPRVAGVRSISGSIFVVGITTEDSDAHTAADIYGTNDSVRFWDFYTNQAIDFPIPGRSCGRHAVAHARGLPRSVIATAELREWPVWPTPER